MFLLGDIGTVLDAGLGEDGGNAGSIGVVLGLVERDERCREVEQFGWGVDAGECAVWRQTDEWW